MNAITSATTVEELYLECMVSLTTVQEESPESFPDFTSVVQVTFAKDGYLEKIFWAHLGARNLDLAVEIITWMHGPETNEGYMLDVFGDRKIDKEEK